MAETNTTLESSSPPVKNKLQFFFKEKKAMTTHSVTGHKLKTNFNEQLRQGSKEGLGWAEILVCCCCCC